MKLAILVLLGVTLRKVVDASPTGAAGCAIGEPAVGGAHLSYPTTTGSLADGGITAQVVESETDSSSPAMLMVGEAYFVMVTREDGFKGVLINTDAPSTTLMEGVNTQEASVCTSAQGVTHMNADLKTEAGGVIQADAPGTVNIGVTVVINNNAADGSEYYYSSFPVEFVAPDTTETPAPTPASAPASTPASAGPAVATTMTIIIAVMVSGVVTLFMGAAE
mmetsp:Transcript_20203/g.36489  ORF Transcript_20203/g.36489 Transcript_20203/m.36489 type:complete len:221 (-) Transcript_20203:249-911(-)